MKFFVDECVSPELALILGRNGFDAIHARDRNRKGEADHTVLARCISENRIIVTHNAIDFRKLVGREEIHPGLIILEEANKLVTNEMLEAVLAFVEDNAGSDRPADYMINRVVDISIQIRLTTGTLPELK